MIREWFRVMEVHADTGGCTIHRVEGRSEAVGGSGLAALLFNRFGSTTEPWDHESQPFILAIGPLSGAFPVMSKTVAAFRSPYHNQYTESHAGGRSALALRFADLDALVITGKAKRLSCIEISSASFSMKDATFMKGMDVHAAGKLLRSMSPRASGHRSILRIGPSGEAGIAMACVNADTYRHFGRLGAGAVLGSKNIKAIVIHGDASFELPENENYVKLFQKIYKGVTGTAMMQKYHSLGTPANIQTLDDIKSLPWRNLQQTHDPVGIKGVNGQRFADDALLRNSACSGCPVGCIHIGFVREKFQKDNRYLYRQIAYDYEPLFSCGTMLGITSPFDVLNVMDEMEKVSVDAISGGVALAWATEATERGLISEKETIVPLAFGDAAAYRKAAVYLGTGANEFYRLLGMGTLRAAEVYGGAEFACVLGQEMAGYATGELFFTAQSLGFRHSHLDTGAYSRDQKDNTKDIKASVDYLIGDEPGRCLLNSMVACLFSRTVYTPDILLECLKVMGYDQAENIVESGGENIRRARWKLRFATGFRPEDIKLPKRFYSIKTWKGPVDPGYLNALKEEYGRRLREFA